MADDRYQYQRKAEALLRKAADTADMRERGRLIDEAYHWHRLALEGPSASTGHDNDDRHEGQATG
jgi:hypothetical protein